MTPQTEPIFGNMTVTSDEVSLTVLSPSVTPVLLYREGRGLFVTVSTHQRGQTQCRNPLRGSSTHPRDGPRVRHRQ